MIDLPTLLACRCDCDKFPAQTELMGKWRLATVCGEVGPVVGHVLYIELTLDQLSIHEFFHDPWPM